jgi:spermidine/putrescine transport system permease protein
MKFIRRLFKQEFPFAFATPILLWQFIFFFVPLSAIFALSFFKFDSVAQRLVFTLEHYVRILQPIYIKVILSSFILATLTTSLCLLIAYPLAYYLSFKIKRFQTAFLFLLILPSWTNLIVQIYAWFFVLEKGGVLSNLFYFLGITKNPEHLVSNYYATLAATVYCYIPFMILPLYSILVKIDWRLIEASADLGANRFVTLKRVIFPLSAPGVFVGSLLVFASSFGEYVIPDLLGGARHMFWGTLIVQKFLISRDWASGFAFVAAGILFMAMVFGSLGCMYLLYKKITRRTIELEEWTENGRA